MRHLLIAFAVAGLAFAGCGAPASDSAPSSEEETNNWVINDFNTASALASEEGKPLLIDLYADWCGPCVTLGEDYFTSPELQPVLNTFVLLRMDVDSPDGRSMAEKYDVVSIPTVIIAEADGTEIERIVGITRTSQGYAAELQNIMDSM